MQRGVFTICLSSYDQFEAVELIIATSFKKSAAVVVQPILAHFRTPLPLERRHASGRMARRLRLD
jgi:hypothetical protein